MVTPALLRQVWQCPFQQANSLGLVRNGYSIDPDQDFGGGRPPRSCLATFAGPRQQETWKEHFSSKIASQNERRSSRCKICRLKSLRQLARTSCEQKQVRDSACAKLIPSLPHDAAAYSSCSMHDVYIRADRATSEVHTRSSSWVRSASSRWKNLCSRMLQDKS